MEMHQLKRKIQYGGFAGAPTVSNEFFDPRRLTIMLSKKENS
jgi:hypothetical protein